MPKHLQEQINYYEPNLMLIRLRLSRPDPKQAVPILCCSRSLREQYPTLGGKYDAASASFSVVNKCIFVRDATLKFYLRKSFGSDFGRISCNQVFRLEDRKWLLIRLSLTTTVRKGVPCEFVLVPFRDLDVCPVFWLDHYVRACRTLGVQLSESYFFRTTDRGKCVGERPFRGSAVSNRLRVHLSGAKLDAGETTHSFRVGLSNTLSLLGCKCQEPISCHV